MVLLFTIASVVSQPPVILYTVPFSDALDANATEMDKTLSNLSEKQTLEIRKHRRKLSADIINKVKTEFDFNASVAFPSPFGLADTLVDPYPREYETGGIFSYKIDVEIEKIVCWHALRGRAYILVCDKHENRMLAGQILILLIRKLQEYLPATNVLLLEPVHKVEIVTALVNAFLPNGQLLFAHRRVLKHLDKELHKLISHSL